MPGRQPLILCIDDGSGISGRRALLERYGYEVIAATSDRAAFSAVADYPVDAVILDLEITGRSRAHVRRFKDIKPHIPVLLVCSSSKILPHLPAVDAVVVNHEPPIRLVKVLEHLLAVEFPFFARWFGNWKHRARA